MKKFLLLTLAAMPLLAGCAIELGGGTKSTVQKPTVGQQLVDLQHARESGAISEAEFQSQKTKVLESR
jgi:hypothetical protein